MNEDELRAAIVEFVHEQQKADLNAILVEMRERRQIRGHYIGSIIGDLVRDGTLECLAYDTSAPDFGVLRVREQPWNSQPRLI